MLIRVVCVGERERGSYRHERTLSSSFSMRALKLGSLNVIDSRQFETLETIVKISNFLV